MFAKRYFINQLHLVGKHHSRRYYQQKEKSDAHDTTHGIGRVPERHNLGSIALARV